MFLANEATLYIDAVVGGSGRVRRMLVRLVWHKKDDEVLNCLRKEANKKALTDSFPRMIKAIKKLLLRPKERNKIGGISKSPLLPAYARKDCGVFDNNIRMLNLGLNDISQRLFFWTCGCEMLSQ